MSNSTDWIAAWRYTSLRCGSLLTEASAPLDSRNPSCCRDEFHHRLEADFHLNINFINKILIFFTILKFLIASISEYDYYLYCQGIQASLILDRGRQKAFAKRETVGITVKKHDRSLVLLNRLILTGDKRNANCSGND